MFIGLVSTLLCSYLKQLRESLETFEASTNAPSMQIHHIDPRILRWNFPMFSIASSKFQTIKHQAPSGNYNLANEMDFESG